MYKLITNNFGLKVTALILAIITWFYAKGELKKSIPTIITNQSSGESYQ